ncbi:putative acylesterase/phospholipase RssA [Roseiarcus fermentans]|uniref:Putative acylesterase/phospholipase RssA n=1 Tax=Roseiarcus fermentans TaxID=1473586 RepID=A0A366EK44_9HYPH|nr:patatin-like phospholipase family protein [Roseiarcus fermentans]RBP02704.1 putative acylesterase/phospholipase RssA [Roseiarcus fermentans]
MRGRRMNGKVGIALAGGGPLGGIYEIGALNALETALEGLSLTDLDLYVGVSSGAFVAAGLANGIAPSEMNDMFILDRSHHDPFEPDLLLRPAFGEFARRLSMIPELVQGAFLGYLGAPARGFVESFARLTRGLPNGLFDNGAIAAYLARLFGKPGRTDDFRKLERKLFIVATDLDNGKATPFGAPGFDHIPISEAVKASAALPGLYPPARIDGRDYVDGALKKTLHASVALKEGAKLLICINPLVPFDAELAARSGRRPRPLAEQGLAAVLSQTFRSLIYSRMRVGMERYKTEFPDADIVVFEPARDDEVIFFANVFSYADRKRLAEHACRHTLSELAARADELAPVFARHGIALRREALGGRLPPEPPAGKGRRLWNSVRPLDSTLDALEKALTRDQPGRSKGGKRDAAKTAAPHA